MAHLTNFSFEFFYEIFTEDASPHLLYHGAKKSKMTKNPNQGGSCLKSLKGQKGAIHETMFCVVHVVNLNDCQSCSRAFRNALQF